MYTMESKDKYEMHLSDDKIIRVGTRESALAMAQTEEVVKKLKSNHPEIIFKVGTTRSINSITCFDWTH